MTLDDGFDVWYLMPRGDDEAAGVLADRGVHLRLHLDPGHAAAVGALADEATGAAEFPLRLRSLVDLAEARFICREPLFTGRRHGHTV